MKVFHMTTIVSLPELFQDNTVLLLLFFLHSDYKLRNIVVVSCTVNPFNIFSEYIL